MFLSDHNNNNNNIKIGSSPAGITTHNRRLQRFENGLLKTNVDVPPSTNQQQQQQPSNFDHKYINSANRYGSGPGPGQSMILFTSESPPQKWIDKQMNETIADPFKSDSQRSFSGNYPQTQFNELDNFKKLPSPGRSFINDEQKFNNIQTNRYQQQQQPQQVNPIYQTNETMRNSFQVPNTPPFQYNNNNNNQKPKMSAKMSTFFDNLDKKSNEESSIPTSPPDSASNLNGNRRKSFNYSNAITFDPIKDVLPGLNQPAVYDPWGKPGKQQPSSINLNLLKNLKNKMFF
jgi:hypothetical protein